MRSDTIQLGFNVFLPRAGTRMLRLAGLAALLGLLVGTGSPVYAVTPTEGAAPAAQAEPAAGVTAETPVTSAQERSVSAGPIVSDAPAPLVPALKGKKDKKKKREKPPKLTPVHIEQGTLTVDGWTGKARLNYDIADLKYIYVWAPGIGTVVASNQKFALGKLEPAAFNGNTLTLEANGHIIQISSEKKLLKDKKPAPAYVYLDTAYKTSSAFPEMGYGNGKDAPYAWPGAKEAPVNKGGNVAPPPLPAGMRPSIARPTCPPAAPTPTTGPTTAPRTVAAPCPASSSPTSTAPSSPSATPPVPLPGYSSGTTTAAVDSGVPVTAP